MQSTRPLLDHEIRAAIESLEASTAAIDKQTEALKVQFKELKSQMGIDYETGECRTKSLAKLHRKYALEKQQVDVAVLCPFALAFSFPCRLTYCIRLMI